MIRINTRSAAAIAAIFLTTAIASAQSPVRLIAMPWERDDLSQSYDHPIIETSGHVDNAPSNTHLFAWDSFGRVRFNREDQESSFVAYRILTMDAGTDTPSIKSIMDEFDLSYSMHLGEMAGWNWGTTLGVGYSSTHPFLNSSGLFGIGSINAEKSIDADNSILLAIDYSGNGGLLPDVPLPGFAFIHQTEKLDFMLGYPLNSLAWRPVTPVELTARYAVPFSADVDLEYRLAKHFGVFGDAGNFFQGFVRSDGDITNRQFFQMRQAEAGIRLIFDPIIDSTIGIGYAFDQGFSRGFDVRDLHSVSHISSEPYLAFIVRGRF